MKKLLIFISILVSFSLHAEGWITKLIGDSGVQVSVPENWTSNYETLELELALTHKFNVVSTTQNTMINIWVTAYKEPLDSTYIPAPADCLDIKQRVSDIKKESEKFVLVSGIKTSMVSCKSQSINYYFLSFLQQNSHITITIANQTETTELNINKFIDNVVFTNQKNA